MYGDISSYLVAFRSALIGDLLAGVAVGVDGVIRPVHQLINGFTVPCNSYALSTQALVLFLNFVPIAVLYWRLSPRAMVIEDLEYREPRVSRTKTRTLAVLPILYMFALVLFALMFAQDPSTTLANLDTGPLHAPKTTVRDQTGLLVPQANYFTQVVDSSRTSPPVLNNETLLFSKDMVSVVNM
jgi:hypothetical protein